MFAVIVFYVGLAVLALGWLAAVFHALRDNKLWALLVLLLPVLALVHIALYWKELEVRRSLLMLLLGSALLGVGIVGGAVLKIPFLAQSGLFSELEEVIPVKEEPLSNEAEAAAIELPEGDNYDPIISGSQYEEVDVEPLAPEEDKTVKLPAGPKKVYRVIAAGNLPAAIGKDLKLTLKNGETKLGKLTQIDEYSVSLESNLGAGEIGYAYPLEEIVQAEVLLTQGESVPEVPKVEEAPEGQGSEVIQPDSEAGSDAPPSIEGASEQITSEVQDSIAEQEAAVVQEIETTTTQAVEATPEVGAQIMGNDIGTSSTEEEVPAVSESKGE